MDALLLCYLGVRLKCMAMFSWDTDYYFLYEGSLEPRLFVGRSIELFFLMTWGQVKCQCSGGFLYSCFLMVQLPVL